MFPVPRLLVRPDAVPADDKVLWQDPAVWTPTPSVTDALVRPDEAAAALALLDPDGPALTALSMLRASALSDGGLVDALVASEKLLAMVSAKQQEFVAEIARRDPDGGEFLADEVGCALKIAPATAVQKLEDAVQLTGPARVFPHRPPLGHADHLLPQLAQRPGE